MQLDEAKLKQMLSALSDFQLGRVQYLVAEQIYQRDRMFGYGLGKPPLESRNSVLLGSVIDQILTRQEEEDAAEDRRKVIGNNFPAGAFDPLVVEALV